MQNRFWRIENNRFWQILAKFWTDLKRQNVDEIEWQFVFSKKMCAGNFLFGEQSFVKSNLSLLGHDLAGLGVLFKTLSLQANLCCGRVQTIIN